MTPDEAWDALRRWEAGKLPLENEKRMQRALVVAKRVTTSAAPADEGHLRASIQTATRSDGQETRGRVYATAEYAPFVHQGTGIYALEGNGRKTPWVWKGESVKYRGWHRTVGQRPQPFIKDSIEGNLAAIAAALGGR